MIGGGIPLWVITLVYFLVDFSGMANNVVIIIPHLISGLIGFLFINQLKKGNDLGGWMNNVSTKISGLLSPKKKSGEGFKNTMFYKQGNKAPFVKKTNLTQQRVDAILDKINQHGYEKLTDEEKKILKRASQEDL